MTRGAIFIDNEDCVKNVINKLYWDSMAAIKKEEESEENTGKYVFLAIAIIVVFLVALTLFIIYFKRQREAQGEETTEGLTATTP